MWWGLLPAEGTGEPGSGDHCPRPQEGVCSPLDTELHSRELKQGQPCLPPCEQQNVQWSISKTQDLALNIKITGEDRKKNSQRGNKTNGYQQVTPECNRFTALGHIRGRRKVPDQQRWTVHVPAQPKGTFLPQEHTGRWGQPKVPLFK